MSKIALVTGAAKRLGKEMAMHLAMQGYCVVIHCNNSVNEAKKLQKKIEQEGQLAYIFQSDLAAQEECLDLIESVIKRFKKIDVLVNNASIFNPQSFKKSKRKDLQDNLDVHLLAPYELTQVYAKRVKKGHIINILDTSIAHNRLTHFPYLVSKKALASFTQMAAVDLAPGIRVNAICPGFILPPEEMKSFSVQKRVKNIPLKKKGNAKNILQGLDYLIENDFVTGQMLFIDGGEHLT